MKKTGPGGAGLAAGPVILPLRKESDVFEAAGQAHSLAGQAGFTRLDCNLIATAVSEIAMNVIRYADKGSVRIANTANKKGLFIEVKDQGPGIHNPDQALTDGFTTSKASLGVGMGAARRAMDIFIIHTRPGKGTRVRMEKYLPVPRGLVEYGVVSLPDDHYEENGDSYYIREFGGDKVLLAVIDGLGEGRNAYRSALLARETIETYHHLPLDSILYKCDAVFKKKGDPYGASIGLLLIKPRSFHYAAVGDTFLKLLTGRDTGPPSQRGMVGPFRIPVIRVIKKACRTKNMVIALCTDGIKDHFSGKDLPLGSDVHSIADHIINRYRREFGDATVLISRFNRS